MGQFVRFQLYDNKGAQQPIVEHEVCKILVVFYQQSLLPCDKGESLAQFKKEISNMGDECALQVLFIISRFPFQPEKLQDHWVFDDFQWRFGGALFSCHSQHLLLVIAHQQPFI